MGRSVWLEINVLYIFGVGVFIKRLCVICEVVYKFLFFRRLHSSSTPLHAMNTLPAFTKNVQRIGAENWKRFTMLSEITDDNMEIIMSEKNIYGYGCKPAR